MLTEKDFTDIPENAVRLIGTDWMLISAGVPSDCNTMTASWGGIGNLWNKPVAFIFVRPQRYTLTFLEKSDYFSLCFFDEKYRDILNYCGAVSGRNSDKISKTGLEIVNFRDKTIYFKQVRIALICRKLYYQDLNPEFFVDQSLNIHYPKKDYHRMYIGEIEKTFVADNFEE